LSAVSWLPGYHVGSQSVAALRPAEQALAGFPVAAATSLFWPNLFGQFQGSTSLPDNITFLHLYQGVPALLLVLSGLAFLIRSSRSRPFVAAALAAMLWMFGTTFFLSEAFYVLIPGLLRRSIYPDFLLSYFSLFFAALAAFALDGWERSENRQMFSPKLALRLALLAVVISLLVSVAGSYFPAESPVANRTSKAAGTLLLVAMTFGLCGFVLRQFDGSRDQTVRRRPLRRDLFRPGGSRLAEPAQYVGMGRGRTVGNGCFPALTHRPRLALPNRHQRVVVRVAN